MTLLIYKIKTDFSRGMPFVKKHFLSLIVFLTGAAVLIIEITAIRVLSPYFGNTLFAFSSVIGVILGALSLGYYAGGTLADKKPLYSVFFFLILLSGIFAIGMQFLAKTLLPGFGALFDVRTGPVVSSFVLFFVPGFLLGTMSPFAIKLQSLQEEGIGKVSGRIFFWSTLGSIAGSFGAGFYLIPRWGISTLMLSVGAFLFLMGAVGYILALAIERKRIPLAAGFKLLGLCVFSGALGLLSQPAPSKAIFQKDGLYSKITVEEVRYKDLRVRLLRLDGSWESGVIMEGPDELPFEYTRYYRIYEVVNPSAERALFLGGGAYTMPRRLLLDTNNITRVDVVEIEPTLFELAKKYFRLSDVADDPRFFNHITDGRRFLRETKETYDAVFGDVYYTIESIPPHFTTREFFELARSRLTQNGIFLMNVIGTLDPKGAPFLFAEMKTLKTVFPNSYFFAVVSPDSQKPQNFIFLGLNDDAKKLDVSAPAFTQSPHSTIRSLAEKMLDVSKLDLNSALLLTDDYAPVEYLVSKFL